MKRSPVNIELAAKDALLLPEEQIELGRRVKALVELAQSKGIAVKILKAEGIKELTAQATKEELIVVKEGLAARARYALANTGLIGHILKRVLRRNQFISHVEKADLFQEGVIGLYKAIENFDPALGYKFSTYAAWWIQQEIERAIQRSDTVVSVPGSSMRVAWEIETKISEIIAQCRAQSKPVPSYAELADKIGKTQKQVTSAVMARRASRCEPMDRGITNVRSSAGLDVGIDARPVLSNCRELSGGVGVNHNTFDHSFGAGSQMLDQLDRKLKVEQIAELCEKLPEVERLVFEMRFGIGYHEHSFREIKEVTGVSEKEAKQIIASCIAKIKFCLEL